MTLLLCVDELIMYIHTPTWLAWWVVGGSGVQSNWWGRWWVVIKLSIAVWKAYCLICRYYVGIINISQFHVKSLCYGLAVKLSNGAHCIRVLINFDYSFNLSSSACHCHWWWSHSHDRRTRGLVWIDMSQALLFIKNRYISMYRTEEPTNERLIKLNTSKIATFCMEMSKCCT